MLNSGEFREEREDIGECRQCGELTDGSKLCDECFAAKYAPRTGRGEEERAA